MGIFKGWRPQTQKVGHGRACTGGNDERKEVQGIHGRGTSRDEGARPRAKVGSAPRPARGQGGRGERRAREDRRDVGTGSRHGRAAPCHHQGKRASPLAENLVRDARVRQQGRQGRLLLPKRAEVQLEVRDARLQRPGEPRRRRHVAGLLRAEGVECHRRGKDRRAREESGELRTELATRATMSMATRTDTHSPALHVADSHDLIRVHGARENNLKDVSIEIPKRRLTLFTGVSGSGKSSLVFGTIAAESQRLINETYSAFVQGFMPTLARPEVDVLEGLTTAIIVDQERMGGDPRSTVGTATDTGAMLRILFSRLGKPYIGPPGAFTFNVPSVKASGAMTVDKGKGERIVVRNAVYHGGMCSRCEGMGSVSDIDLTQLYDESKSLNEGAITVPGYKAGGWSVKF